MVPRGHDSCDVRLCQGKLKMHIKSNCFYGISNSHSGLQDGKIVQCTKLLLSFEAKVTTSCIFFRILAFYGIGEMGYLSSSNTKFYNLDFQSTTHITTSMSEQVCRTKMSLFFDIRPVSYLNTQVNTYVIKYLKKYLPTLQSLFSLGRKHGCKFRLGGIAMRNYLLSISFWITDLKELMALLSTSFERRKEKSFSLFGFSIFF